MTDTATSYNWESEELHCPYCKTTIRYYDIKDSAWFGCGHCHTFFNLSDESNPVKLREFGDPHPFSPILNLGDEGFLHGKKFVVTGYLQKYDSNEHIYWTEYYLFNPEEDCNYVLAAMGVDWYFTWKSERQDFRVMNTNVMAASYVAMQHDPYRKYDHYVSYVFDITYASGEFDTNILDDINSLQVEEYADPPDMIASETKGDEIIWYRGTHYSEQDVKRAFSPNIRKRFAETFDDVYERKWPIVRNFALIMIACIFITQIVVGSIKQSRRLLSQMFVSTVEEGTWKQNPVDAGMITVSGTSALSFNISTSLYNEWAEIPVSLVNIKTGKTYEFTKVLEYYTGVEGGESWSEGSNEADAVLSGVEAGTYKVNIYPNTDAPKALTVQVEIIENTFLSSNIFITLLLICAYPAYLFLRKQNRDANRSSFY